MSPTGQEPKFQFVVLVLLRAFLHLPGTHEWYGPQRISHAILIANGLVLIKLCNENQPGHVPICILGN